MFEQTVVPGVSYFVWMLCLRGHRKQALLYLLEHFWHTVRYRRVLETRLVYGPTEDSLILTYPEHLDMIDGRTTL